MPVGRPSFSHQWSTKISVTPTSVTTTLIKMRVLGVTHLLSPYHQENVNDLKCGVQAVWLKRAHFKGVHKSCCQASQDYLHHLCPPVTYPSTILLFPMLSSTQNLNVVHMWLPIVGLLWPGITMHFDWIHPFSSMTDLLNGWILFTNGICPDYWKHIFLVATQQKQFNTFNRFQ